MTGERKEQPQDQRPAESDEDRSAEGPPTASEEAAEGFITEVESLTPGVAPSEPGTFARDPE
jgi:hypothetical protein